MTRTQNALLLTSLASVAILAACASTGSPRQVSAVQAARNAVTEAENTSTILDAHRAEVTAVEARLALGETGTAALSMAESQAIAAYGREFIETGRGMVAISVPMGAGNQQTAQQLAAEVQRALYAAGVDYAKMAMGGYQAVGDPHAPVTLSFSRYQAAAVDCVPWSNINAHPGFDNATSPRFGCAGSANLAAMVADPGDLIPDRHLAPGDAARTQTGIDQLRKGTLPKASGTVKGGNK